MTTIVYSPLTAEEAADKVIELESLIATCTTNMVELTTQRTYMTLGSPSFANLAGVTLQQCQAILPPFEELFSMISLVTGQVSAARAILSALPKKGREAKLQEVTDLLKVIKLPPVAVPLEQRGLLTAAELAQTVTSDRLLAAMAEAFTPANQLVFKIKNAWASLNSDIIKLDDDIKGLRQDAADLGALSTQELAQAEQVLAAAKASVYSDPLSASANILADVRPVLEACRVRINHVKALKSQVIGQFAEAEQALEQLKSAHAASLQAVEERKAKVTIDHEDQLTMPLADQVVTQLGSWLERLRTTIKEGKYQAAAVGLTNWTAQAVNRKSAAESAFQANDALLRERRDMRGLVEALRARAAADKRAEEAELMTLFSTVSQLLYSRPTPMTRARELVKQYQDKVLE